MIPAERAAAPAARILVFARAPVAGRCKTRLIPKLGAVGAARLHRRLLLRTLRAALASGCPVELWRADAAMHGAFLACRRELGVRLRRQAHGDLGRRMALALRDSLRDTPAAVLVGTDCPTLDAADLRRAAGAKATLTLQPSTDGGYVLIAARRIEPRALQGIAWSSGRELGQTRARLRRLGLDAHTLPARADLDTPRDWLRARRAGEI